MEKSKELKAKANDLFKAVLAAATITDEMKKDGLELLESEQTAEVIETYKEAIGSCPTDESEHLSILHNNLGIVYLKMGKKLQAKGEFSKSIEINEKYAKPLWHRVNIRRKEEDYEGAIADAKKI